MDKIRVLNSLTNIRKDLAEARGYDYSGVEVLEYVIEKIDSGEWTEHLPKEKEVEDKPITRAEILDAAKKCVCGQREQDYGTPESNFQLIADLWNSYLGLPYDHSEFNETRVAIPEISPTDVAMMMSLMKIARIKNGGGTGDSFVDLAGYAACGGEINSAVPKEEKKSGRYPWGQDKTIKAQKFPNEESVHEDFIRGRYCENCKWQDENSEGKHCDWCSHNEIESDESHWEKE